MSAFDHIWGRWSGESSGKAWWRSWFPAPVGRICDQPPVGDLPPVQNNCCPGQQHLLSLSWARLHPGFAVGRCCQCKTIAAPDLLQICNISYKISKGKKYFWTTIIQQFSGIWRKMRWNNMPSWALSRWGLIFNRTLNTILLRIRELHLKRVFAGVLFR